MIVEGDARGYARKISIQGDYNNELIRGKNIVI